MEENVKTNKKLGLKGKRRGPEREKGKVED
jgi:hypothetical protein